MAKNTHYRIKNWKEYNEALVHRGSLTLWISDDALAGWLQPRTGKCGHPVVYSDAAILCTLTLRAVFRLPLRQTEGLVRSIVAMMKLSLPVPDYSTLCLRMRSLAVPVLRRSTRPLHLLLDSTGLKLRGAGEWRREHQTRDRTWRKFHIGLDAETQEIVVEELSLPGVQDATAGVALVESITEPIASVTADGAYDKMKMYLVCHRKQIRPIIPPQKNAKVRRWIQDPADGQWKPFLSYAAPRHRAIRAIRRKGRKRWKIESGYHRRSLAETAMFRFKRILGADLRSKKTCSQHQEVALRCYALNVMTAHGMPQSQRVG